MNKLYLCTACGQEKDLGQFYNWKKEHKCKSCKAEKDRQRKEENKRLNLAATPKIVRTEKNCARCKKLGRTYTHPIDQFPIQLTSEDGYGPRCKQCNYEVSFDWQKKNPGKRAAQSKRFEEKHKERRKDQAKARRQKRSAEKKALRARIAAAGIRSEAEFLEEIGEKILTWELLEERGEDLSQYKVCTGPCGRLKYLDDYYSNKKSADGKQSWCKVCHNKDRIRRYWEKTKDLENQRTKEWRKENPLKAREQTMRRRARIKEAQIDPVSYETILERDGMWCYLCSSEINPDLEYPDPKSLSFDHQIPLTKGGSHSAENIHPAHLDCNNKKSNK